MSDLARIRAGDVADGTATHLDGGPNGICVVRIGDDFYAVADRCSHANVALSEGDVNPGDASVECWKHGSAFSLRTGEPQSLPAVRAVAVYDVRREGEEIVVSERVAASEPSAESEPSEEVR